MADRLAYKNPLWGELDEQFDDTASYTASVKSNIAMLAELAMSDTSLVGGGAGSGWGSARRGKAAQRLVNVPPEGSATVHAALCEACARGMGDGGPMPEFEEPLHHHRPRVPIRHVDKEYCPWCRGATPAVDRLSSSDCRRALVSAAALALCRESETLHAARSVLEALADATDNFLRTVTLSLRVAVQQDSMGNTSGFPDAVSKIFSELRIEGLSSFMSSNTAEAHRRAAAARASLAADQTAPPSSEPEVPQLHFPAGLEALGEQLAPGFRMLRSLESGELLPDIPDLLRTPRESPQMITPKEEP